MGSPSVTELLDALGRMNWCAVSLVALVVVFGIDRYFDNEKEQRSTAALTKVLLQCTGRVSRPLDGP